MASGSEAARNVSQLVLVNNDFASMPEVVAEGRRTINNVERSSSLFLVKTIYSIVLSIFFIFFRGQYPFEPIQLTLIGALTIGFPSFVLALQPNKDRIKGNFTFNIISRAMPAAICVISNIIIAAVIGRTFGIPHPEISTISVYLTALSCLLLIVRLSVPFNLLRTVMFCISVSGLALAGLFFGKLFSITLLGFESLLIFLLCAIATIIVFNILYSIAQYLIDKNKNQ